MLENRAAALKTILVFEGGNDDDPRDPGGRTSQGIIQRVYDAYRRRKGLPTQDVFKITNAERDEIYYTQYLAKVRFDELPPGVDLVVADGGVNAGPSQSIKWLQRALGVGADGVLGEVTLERTQNHPNHDLLISQILDRRTAFYKGLTTYKTFGKGWLSRVAQVKKKGQAMAMGDVGPIVVYVPNGNKKADPVNFKPLPAMGTPAALSSGGFVTSTLTTVQDALTPLSSNERISTILTIIAVAGVLIGAGGAAWAYYNKKRREELVDVLDLVQMQGANDNAGIPQEVLRDYADPEARGGETGNIAKGSVTTSGRTAGDTEDRVNPEASVPEAKKIDVATAA